MSLRRSSRVQVLNAEGVLRVWRDVVGHRTDSGEYVVVSNEAAVKGERLTVYFAGAEQRAVPVRVVDSHLIIRDGAVQHKLRLSPLDSESLGSHPTTRGGNREAE